MSIWKIISTISSSNKIDPIKIKTLSFENPHKPGKNIEIFTDINIIKE